MQRKLIDEMYDQQENEGSSIVASRQIRLSGFISVVDS